MGNQKILSFTDLIAWQEGHKLVLMIYKYTKIFPKDELYSLTSQMRRCSISITSNIAEGFGGKSKKEKEQFYWIAIGSIFELKNQLIISKDLGYLNKNEFDTILQQMDHVHKLIRGLAKSSSSY